MAKRTRTHSSKDLLDSPGVPRPGIIASIFEAFADGGVVALVAEPGLGKHLIADAVMARARGLDYVVSCSRFSSKSFESSCRRLRACGRSALERAKAGEAVLVVIEGIPSLPDSYLARARVVIDRLGVNGIKALLVMEPPGETLLDGLSCRLVLRARDLLVSEGEFRAWAEFAPGRSYATVARLTHGVPALVAALRGTTETNDGHLDGPFWNRRLGELLAYTVGPWLIEEEAKLRCSMLALGSGTVSDLEQLGLRVSLDVFSQLELDAPLFGVCAKDLSFTVIPASFELVGAVLAASCRAWPRLVARLVEVLAGQGEVLRAGTIASACAEIVSGARLALRYPVELVDVGMASFVVRALEAVPASDLKGPGLNDGSSGSSPLSGAGEPEDALEHPDSLAREALRLVGAVPWVPQGVRRVAEATMGSEVAGRDVTRLHVALLRAWHAVRCGPLVRAHEVPAEVRALSEAARSSGDRLALVIACHVRVVALVVSGSALEAFRELMLCRALRELRPSAPSAFSALLQYDFEALRRFIGDPESPPDRKAFLEAEHRLAIGGPPAVHEEAQSWLAMARFVADAGAAPCDLGRMLARTLSRGEHAALALGHLVSALSDVGSGTYRRAYIHVREAREQASLAAMGDVDAVAEMAGRAVAAGLGERLAALEAGQSNARLGDRRGGAASGAGANRRARPRAYEKAGSGGGTAARARGEGRMRGLPRGADPRRAAADVRALSDLHRALYGGVQAEIDEASTRLRGVPPRAGVVALAALFCRIDRTVGSALLGALPVGWRARCPASAPQGPKVMAARESTRAGASEREAWLRPPRVGGTLQPLEVCVLGGLGVLIGGVRIPENAWRRRHARTLLIMLALTPGHALARYEAAECFWPDSDYTRCREGMYTVLSSLRRTLGQSGTSGYVRGEMGRLWLDSELVTCDIDEFEELTRSVMAREVDDVALVSLCLKVDEMYQGGTVQPATDARGLFRRRHEETLRRYVDALLVGSAAALRIGDVRQATWFCESAHVEAPRRADVLASLAQAFEADGRDTDAARARAAQEELARKGGPRASS